MSVFGLHRFSRAHYEFHLPFNFPQNGSIFCKIRTQFGPGGVCFLIQLWASCHGVEQEI